MRKQFVNKILHSIFAGIAILLNILVFKYSRNMYKSRILRRSQIQHLAGALLQRLDFFGNMPTFRILEKPKFTTNIGLIYSVGILIICFTFLLFQFIELSKRTNPSIRMAEKRAINTQAFPLRNDNFTLAISLLRPDFSQLSNANAYYTLSVKNCLRFKNSTDDNKNSESYFSCTSLPTELCNSKHAVSPSQQETFARLLPNPIYCIKADIMNNNPPSLQGSNIAPYYQYLRIEIQACKNSSSTICAPQADIDKILQFGYYTYYLSDNLIQLDSQSSPFEQVVKQELTFFSINQSKQILTEMRIVEVETDDGLIIPSIHVDQALTISKEVQNTQDRKGDFIIYHAIYLENRMTNFTRKYPKMQDILGSVGGLWQALYTLISLFLSPFSSFLMNLEMISKLYRFDESDKQKAQGSQTRIVFKPTGDSQPNIGQDSSRKDSVRPFNQLEAINSKSARKIKSTSIKLQLKRFRDALQHQQTFTLRQKLSILCGCDRKKMKLVQYATDRFMEKLDVAYMVTKFYEIERLKMILLSKDQLRLFNISSKPAIPIDLISGLANDEALEKLSHQRNFQFILDEEKSYKQRLQDGMSAYKNLKSNEFATVKNQTILEMIDPEIIKIFDLNSLDVNHHESNNDLPASQRQEEDPWQVNAEKSSIQEPLKFFQRKV